MNSAKCVDEQIKALKKSGIPLSDAAWQTALLCVGWAYVFGARGAYCTPSNRRSAYKDKYPTIKSACKNFDGDKYCSGCKWFPNGERTRFFDCRGFTYWVILQIYGWKIMGAGCTTQWNNEDNWCAKGEVVDGIPQGVIVCLFYYKKDDKGRRTSTLSHTGLYYNGQTVECSNNVQRSKTLNKKWEVWAVPKCCESEYKGLPEEPAENGPITPPTEQDETKVYPTLRRGDKGEKVREMQRMLIARGYSLPRYGADGDFGAETEDAVRRFQRDWGLKEDGICGPDTWERLLTALDKPRQYEVTIKGLSKDEAEALCNKYSGVMKEMV